MWWFIFECIERTKMTTNNPSKIFFKQIRQGSVLAIVQAVDKCISNFLEKLLNRLILILFFFFPLVTLVDIFMFKMWSYYKMRSMTGQREQKENMCRWLCYWWSIQTKKWFLTNCQKPLRVFNESSKTPMRVHPWAYTRERTPVSLRML